MLGQLVPLVRGFALDNSERAQWNTFATVLNPGNHDDVPPTAELLTSASPRKRSSRPSYTPRSTAGSQGTQYRRSRTQSLQRPQTHTHPRCVCRLSRQHQVMASSKTRCLTAQ